MAALWVEFESSDNDGAARWELVTDEQIDRILAYAEAVIGRPADTIA